MDIIIINPGEIRHDYITEHLGISSLNAYATSKGFEADALDMAIEELSIADAQNKILKIQPKMIGLSLLDDSKKRGFALVEALRKAGYTGKIIVGGYFATFASGDILRDFPQIDFVVRGEGELILAELMECVINQKGKLSDILGLSYRDKGNVIENPSRPLIHDLDVLPPVDRKYASDIINKNSHLRLYATRGCWGKCSFCDIIGLYSTSRGKSWRRRSAKHLVDEIEQLTQKFNTDYFVFNDDQFLIKGKRSLEHVESFTKELKRRGLKIKFELMCRADTIECKAMSLLKDAGLQRVFLGLESFDPKQLQRYRKGITVRQNLKAVITLYNLKIDVIASVILADAYTTLWDLLKQFVIIFELRRRYFNSPNCQISVNKKLEIYRGSSVYQDYKANGLLTKDNYFEGYDFKLKLWTDIRLKLFTLEENLGRLILKPGEVMKNMIKSLQWRFAQTKKMLAGT